MLFYGLNVIALIAFVFASVVDVNAGRKGCAATIEKKDKRAAAAGRKESRGERKKDKAGRAAAYAHLRRCLVARADKEGWSHERFVAECDTLRAAFSDDYDADADSE